MKAKRKAHSRGNPFTVVVIVVALLAALFYLNEANRPILPGATAKSGDFTVLQGCKLIEDENRNDGDSFRLRHGDKEYVIRLYFVDCPEKRLHSYDADRIADQGKYFKGLSEKDTLELGDTAKNFSLDILRSERFEVLTKFEEVYSSGRHYGLIRFEDGSYLHERLVDQGLARIYTRGTDLPEHSKQNQLIRLSKREKLSQTERIGGWGL
jgi:endonuclease YncB( thermonuclease family)